MNTPQQPGSNNDSGSRVLTEIESDLLLAAEDASAKTCQVCGARGRTVKFDEYVMSGCEFHPQVKT